MSASIAMPPTTPTNARLVSSTIPLTFGVTATGRRQLSSQARSAGAFAERVPAPTTTIGRLASARRLRRRSAACAGEPTAPAPSLAGAGTLRSSAVITALSAASVRNVGPAGPATLAAAAARTSARQLSGVSAPESLVTGPYASSSGSF